MLPIRPGDIVWVGDLEFVCHLGNKGMVCVWTSPFMGLWLRNALKGETLFENRFGNGR
jgi:hypothetical protein